MKYVSDYPKHKYAHSTALRAPQMLPLTGDTPEARYIAMSGNPKRREELVEVRYAAWRSEQEMSA